MRAFPWAVFGFVVGGIIGLAWGQATRSKVPSNVHTSMKNGVITVTVDAKQAALEGAAALIGG